MDETMSSSSWWSALELPGFRFHPTEEELLGFYLKNMVCGMRWSHDIIGFLNIYHHDPWDLPGLAKIGEREWYFYVPRDTRHSNGGRPNRTTKHGFWKATGSDRKVFTLSDPKTEIGLKKTLVFYKGRAPRGSRTDWVMNEYRLSGALQLQRQDIVLCKIYRKATSLKVLEQRAALEEEEEAQEEAILLHQKTHDAAAAADSLLHHHHSPPPPPSSPTTPTTSFSFCSHQPPHVKLKKEDEDLPLPLVLEHKHHQPHEAEQTTGTANEIMVADDLQVAYKFSMDLAHQHSFWPQFSSP